MSGGVFDVPAIENKIAEKEALTAAPDFWSNPSKAEKVMTDIKALKNRIEPWRELVAAAEDMETLYELGIESGDQSTENELKEMYEAAKERYEKQSIMNLLDGEVDTAVLVDADDLDLDLLPFLQMILYIVDIGIGDLRDMHQPRLALGQ